jgi:serine/threonine protein kinase
MQEVHSSLQPGTTIRGRYVVEDVLGDKSFSSVYLVRDQRNNQKHFVLKEVPDPGRNDRFPIPFGSKWFQRLEHPALPHIYQIFNDGRNNRAYMLTDYIEGLNLEILQQRQPERRFPLIQVVSLIASIMNAVTYLHSQRHPVIHGDIKPSNIIVRKEGGLPVLVGFSLVKEVTTDATLTFDRYRAPGYKAPEQYSGVTDLRTDIYALGAVLYTLLTGSVPAGALYRARRLSEKKPDPLCPMDKIASDIPEGQTSAIHRAMSMHRGDRYSTVEQFWNALWQGPIFYPMVQRTREQLIAPSAQSSEVDANLPEVDATEHVDITPTQENGEQNTNLPEVDATESVDITPTEGIGELDANLTEVDATETADMTPTQEAPITLLDASPLWQQATEPGIVSSDPVHEPVLSEEVKGPITAPLQEQQQSNDSRKPRKNFLFSLVLLVTLLLSIGVGVSLWFYMGNHQRPISAIPTPEGQLKTTLPATASPNSKTTETPSLAATIYPKVAASYNGIISDIAANLSTKMSLTDIQQQQGNIRGNISGLRWNGPFQGSIDTAKHIKFSFTGDVRQAKLAFDGNMQSDGNIGGTYCSMNLAGKCSDYGIWSVSPAA